MVLAASLLGTRRGTVRRTALGAGRRSDIHHFGPERTRAWARGDESRVSSFRFSLFTVARVIAYWPGRWALAVLASLPAGIETIKA